MSWPRQFGFERFVLAGLCTSAAIHGMVLTLLVIDLVWPFFSLVSARRLPRFEINLQATLPSYELHAEPAAAVEWYSVRAADPTDTNPVESKSEATAVAKSNGQAGNSLPETVSEKIEAAAQRAQERTADDNLKKLDRLTGQLNRISSSESVEEMAGKLGQWLGTAERSSAPASEKVEGEFDYATAQLHDIERKRDSTGAWNYTAVLVDAAGRTRNSAMDATEGESAYRTMQLLKSNPLAELVYRRVAMSLLDKIIQAAQQAEQALPPAKAGSAAPAAETKSPAQPMSEPPE